MSFISEVSCASTYPLNDQYWQYSMDFHDPNKPYLTWKPLFIRYCEEPFWGATRSACPAINLLQTTIVNWVRSRCLRMKVAFSVASTFGFFQHFPGSRRSRISILSVLNFSYIRNKVKYYDSCYYALKMGHIFSGYFTWQTFFNFLVIKMESSWWSCISFWLFNCTPHKCEESAMWHKYPLSHDWCSTFQRP